MLGITAWLGLARVKEKNWVITRHLGESHSPWNAETCHLGSTVPFERSKCPQAVAVEMLNEEGEQQMFHWGDEKDEDRCLDMSNKNITAADIGDFFKSLGDDLKEVSVLKIVDVSGNRVGARNEDMEPIHKLLTASSNSLTALNLCGNPLGEEQRHAGPVIALAETLRGLSRLKVLDLSECTLIGRANHRYRGLIALGKAFAGWKNGLSHLRLCNNSLHSEAALIIAGWLPAVPKLRYLDVSRNLLAVDTLGRRSRVGFDPLCGSLRSLFHLRTLRLGHCGMDDGEAEGVSSFLASSARLECLDLCSNQIHVRGARHLAWAIRSNGTLGSLLLGDNAIGDEGAKLLASAIPYADSLAELDVSSNGLTAGIKEAFIHAALESVTLTTYRLAGNDIPPGDEQAMKRYAAANVELRRVAVAPESYDLGKASTIVVTSLLIKLDKLPPGVVERLKRNPTFTEDDGPMREAVLRASPPTKGELLERSPGATQVASKAKSAMFSEWTGDSNGLPHGIVTESLGEDDDREEGS